MKTFRVEFAPNARRDMIDYARYIAEQEGSETLALAWYEGMHEAVMRLKKMPRRCALARENTAFEEEIRQLIYQSHRVIFSVHDDAGLVVIHRMWHTSRDDAQDEDLPGIHSQPGS